jgi:hypothetical protein
LSTNKYEILHQIVGLLLLKRRSIGGDLLYSVWWSDTWIPLFLMVKPAILLLALLLGDLAVLLGLLDLLLLFTFGDGVTWIWTTEVWVCSWGITAAGGKVIRIGFAYSCFDMSIDFVSGGGLPCTVTFVNWACCISWDPGAIILYLLPHVFLVLLFALLPLIFGGELFLLIVGEGEFHFDLLALAFRPTVDWLLYHLLDKI